MKEKLISQNNTEDFYESFMMINTTVLSKAFFFYNLKISVVICCVYDFLIGILVFLKLSSILNINDGFLFFFENMILIAGMFFSLIGLESSNNFNRKNAQVYKYWRYFIAFSIPLIELFYFLFNDFCVFDYECSLWKFSITFIFYFLLNLYLTKVVWSFCSRLNKNQVSLLNGRSSETKPDSKITNRLLHYKSNDFSMKNVKVNILKNEIMKFENSFKRKYVDLKNVEKH